MKIYALIIAGIFGAAMVSQGEVIISDDFDNNTISGGSEVSGNTMSFDDGWDVDLTHSASSLTSTKHGFSAQTGSFVKGDVAFRAYVFSFTFTPLDSYSLTDIGIDVGLASSKGNFRAGSGDLTVTISHAGEGTIFTETEHFDVLSGGYTSLDFDPTGTVLNSGTEYTVTATMADVSKGAAVYNLLELKGTARKVDIPESRASALLFGLVGLMGAMQRRRRRRA
jgi:hypothetical protein